MNDTPGGAQGYPGQQGLTDDTSDYNKIAFVVQQMLGMTRTMTLVKVMAVTNDGGVSPVGFVDVQPLVNQVDGVGTATPHGEVFGLPYFRIHGGANAVILDPVIGDIGLAVISDRDISAVKATKAQASPGSKRRFSLSDGVYIGGILNGTPTCYVAFTGGGMTLSPDSGETSITLTPGLVRIVANEVNVHAKVKNTFDANGTGFVYTSGHVATYTDGVSSSHSSPTPPEVPT